MRDGFESEGVSGAAVRAPSCGDPVERLGPMIRGLRRGKGLTLASLARACGLSLGHLSQVERGISTPTIRQLQAIGQALGVAIGAFFAPDEADAPEEDEPHVVRADRRRRLELKGLGLTDELLVPDLDRQLEMLLSTIEPGAGCGESYVHAGEEAGLVLEGMLELCVEDRVYLLRAGDSFSFPSTSPHRYRNPGLLRTRIVWAITPPSF